MESFSYKEGQVKEFHLPIKTIVVALLLKKVILINYYPQYEQDMFFYIVCFLILISRKDFVVYQDINAEPTKVTDNNFKDKVII